MPQTNVRPLLKWVGGKRQLLPELRRFYPLSFKTYIEPFFGSGAVFFDLLGSGALPEHDVVLLDSNADLIGCYEMVRDRPEDVLRALETLAVERAADARGHYYKVRDLAFNPARAAARRHDGRMAYTPDLAAMLIYLNRTGFNGLFRLNARGAFNVPLGRYERPRLVDRERLLKVSAALANARVRLEWGSFQRVKDIAAPGDFLYIDPPYAPVSDTARFTSYTAAPFALDEQRQLQALVLSLANRGCHVLLSNSTAEDIAMLYERDARVQKAGLQSYRVAARRSVNSKASRRGAIEEYIVTNIGRRANQPA